MNVACGPREGNIFAGKMIWKDALQQSRRPVKPAIAQLHKTAVSASISPFRMKRMMTKTIRLTTEVPDNRRINIALPREIPVGPAQLTLSIQTPPESSPSELGDLLQTGFFGLWCDRTDMADNLEFAHRLRHDSWQRNS